MIGLRRRLRQAAGRAVAALATAPRSAAPTSDAAQLALASAGIRSSMSRASGGNASSAWAAWAQRQAQRQQAFGSSSGKWRPASWQQARQQWTDRGCATSNARSTLVFGSSMCIMQARLPWRRAQPVLHAQCELAQPRPASGCARHPGPRCWSCPAGALHASPAPTGRDACAACPAPSHPAAATSTVPALHSPPRCSGYHHFGGRGRPAAAVLYSQDARRRTLRWLVVLGGGAAVVWVTSRQEVPYTGRM